VDRKALAPPEQVGQTPLFTAAYQGYAECCSVLLQHLADVGSQDCRGLTPLHWVLANSLHLAGNQDPKATELVVSVLLAARADATARDHAGHSPLNLAAACCVSLPVDAMSSV